MKNTNYEILWDILSFIGSICTLIIIHENSKMREKINELERENKELKGETI